MAENTDQNNMTADEVAMTKNLAEEVGFKVGGDIDLEAISDIPVEVSVVLGESSISVDQLLKMGKGAIIELDKKVGEPVEIYVNDKCIAKGEVVIVENKVGITMTEVIKNDKE